MVKKEKVTEEKINSEDKFTEEEYIFLIKLLEKKKKGCGWIIDNKDDDIAIQSAMKSSEILSSILGKLELLQKYITE